MTSRQFTSRFVVCSLAIAAIFFAVMLGLFFWNLAGTTSEYSYGVVTIPHQLFYNFLNERMFQTSIFTSQFHYQVDSSGISFNPYAYIHSYVLHIYLTPFLFAPIWNLWPSLSWLYGTAFLVNYLGLVLFAWKYLKHLSPRTFPIKTAAALALLLASGFLFTFQQYAQLMLFGGPFILAAFYFLEVRKFGWFFLSVILVCLTSEDLAMVMATFSAYILIFEPKARRYAVASGLFAVTYLALLLLIVQPAARSELMLTKSTTTAKVVSHILHLFPMDCGNIFVGFTPLLYFFPAFGIVWLLFGKPNVSWWRVAGLVFLAPLPHWGECAVVGASHHLMPPIIFSFAALVLVLGSTPDESTPEFVFTKKRLLLLMGLCVVFILGSLRVLASNLPADFLRPVYRLVGRSEKAERIERSHSEKTSNRRVIEVVKGIPKNRSLVYFTNCSIEGFIVGRSDIWQFPDYYDTADYLVIQPGAREAFFTFSGEDDLSNALAAKTIHEAKDGIITQKMAQNIVHSLVDEKKTHRIAVEEQGVILLERIQKQTIFVPPSTVGLGWLHLKRNDKLPTP